MKLKSDNRSNFSKVLTAYREASYRTAKDFYAYMKSEYALRKEEIPFSYMTYAGYENGSRTPRLETVVQLAQFLNVSLDLLLGLYDLNYIELFLHKLGYETKRINQDTILINVNPDENKYAYFKASDLLTPFYHSYQVTQENIQQALNAEIQETVRKEEQKRTERLAALSAEATANLLGIDLLVFQKNLKTCSSPALFKKDPLLPLFFYYFTHCRPDLEPERTRQIIAYYEKALLHPDEARLSPAASIHSAIAYEPQPRSPLVEQYFIANSTEKNWQKKSYGELKMSFFLSLCHLTSS